MMARPAPDAQQSPTRPYTDEQICHYIAELCSHLQHMSRRPNLKLLHHFLGMARHESERIVKEAQREH